MSIVAHVIRCDVPGCTETVTVRTAADLSDLGWENRCWVNYDPQHHVCRQHIGVDSLTLMKMLEQPAADAE